VPLLTLSERQAGSVPVTQSRFFLSIAESNRATDGSVATWTVPVCLKTNGVPVCRVLRPEDPALALPMDIGLPMLYANAAAKGYYRTAYTPSQYSAIVAKAETLLTPPERIGLLGDRWALVRSGRAGVGDYLDLVLALKQDPNAAVLDTVHQELEKIDSEIASEEDRHELAAVLRREFGPVYTALGSPAKDESFDRQQLRGTLFELLGEAHDSTVLAEAHLLTARALAVDSKRDKTLDPTLSGEAVLVSTSNGDVALYDRLLAVSKDPVSRASRAMPYERWRASRIPHWLHVRWTMRPQVRSAIRIAGPFWRSCYASARPGTRLGITFRGIGIRFMRS
jgi:aminopeptidase N/puromycin-sensitive aminopeptidase